MNVGLNTDQLLTQFNDAMAKIRKLEEENFTLKHMNEVFQDQINQKTEALQKSVQDYESLTIQYEELLKRVTNLYLENQSYHSSSQTSRSSTPIPQSPLYQGNFDERQDDDMLSNLREQLDIEQKKKNEYKLRATQLENELKKAKKAKNEIWNSTFDTFVEMVSPYLNSASSNHITGFPQQAFNADSNSYSFLLEATHSLIKQIQLSNSNKYEQKYLKLKLKYQKLLDKCQSLAQQMAGNQAVFDQAIEEQKRMKQKNQLDEELSQMYRYLKSYERRSNKMASSLPGQH